MTSDDEIEEMVNKYAVRSRYNGRSRLPILGLACLVLFLAIIYTNSGNSSSASIACTHQYLDTANK